MFRTGHPGEQQLEVIKWVGKRFHDENDVDPIISRAADGGREANAVLGKATLRLVRYRGVSTATMVYDQHPVFDHFSQDRQRPRPRRDGPQRRRLPCSLPAPARARGRPMSTLASVIRGHASRRPDAVASSRATRSSPSVSFTLARTGWRARCERWAWAREPDRLSRQEWCRLLRAALRRGQAQRRRRRHQLTPHGARGGVHRQRLGGDGVRLRRRARRTSWRGSRAS